MSTQKLNEVSITQAQTLIHSVLISSFIREVIPTNICLEGSPGVGKSAIINCLPVLLAPKLNVEPENIVVIDIRLSAMEASDVQGIPFVDGGQMKFSTPEWFPTKTHDEAGNPIYYILFMDELMNCNQSVQHAAYRLILDRSIQNGKKLPVSCAVIAAGNKKSDKTGAKPLLPAAANRFGLHLSITKLQSNIEYMTVAGFDPSIVGYLDYRQDAMFQPPTDESAFPTPRTWEFVDDHLKNPMLTADDSLLTIAVAGAIGSEFAVDFMAFREYNHQLPDWKRIRSNDSSYSYKVPSNDTALTFALGVALAYQYIDTLGNQLFDEATNLTNAILKSLPSEIIVVMIRTMKREKRALAQLPRVKPLYEEFKKVAKYTQDD